MKQQTETAGILSANSGTTTATPEILGRCVSIDLEVNPEQAEIFALAAVTHDSASPDLTVKSDITASFEKLDEYCFGFDHVIGHNILAHDLPHLAAASSRFVALADAPIDTLWLNPLRIPTETPTTIW